MFLYTKSVFLLFVYFFALFAKFDKFCKKGVIYWSKKVKNKQKMYEFKGEEKMNYLNEVKKVNKYKSTL